MEVRRSHLRFTLMLCVLMVKAVAVPQAQTNQPSTKSARANAQQRHHFLQMFARSYFSGRTGQLLVVPREGYFITRADPNVSYMHGSPWSYDISIPLMFVAPGIKPGHYSTPAVQQDLAPTIAAALNVSMPATATGRVLPILRRGFPKPRAILLLVLDGMRRDYFDRYAAAMPVLSGLRKRSAWFANAQVNFLPTNTAVGHSSISTGTDPRIHGITGVSIYDDIKRQRHELFRGTTPQDLLALTLSDVWQLATRGRAVIIAQGSIDRAATPLAGHGACQVNGRKVALASYDQTTGNWMSDDNCFLLPEYLKEKNAKTLWSADGRWMTHKIDSTSNIRYSGLFPAFEADSMVEMIERERIGEDEVPDMILLNYKGADFVGHKHGPNSDELRVTLGEMDRNLARILRALEKKVGVNYMLAVTADHGMPAEPSVANGRQIAQTIVDQLHEKFDPREKKLITSYEPENAQIFVDNRRLSLLGLTLRDLARYLESLPFIFAVFTSDEVQRAAAATN